MTNSTQKFNIIPQWGKPTISNSDIFLKDYIDHHSNADTTLLWYELNGDPTADPFNQLLDGSILDNLTDEVKAKINNKTVYIVVNTANECIGPVYDDEMVLVDYINLHTILAAKAKSNGIDPNGIIWITGDLNADAFNDNAEINIISTCVFFTLVDSMFKSDIANANKEHFDHLQQFTNLAIYPNRHINTHRTYMAIRMYQKNLTHRLKMSFPRNLHGKTINDGFCDLRAKAEITPTFDEYNIIDWDNLSIQCLDMYLRDLPRQIDVDPNTNTCAYIDAILTLKEEYQKSFFSIVTETHADGGKLFISEAIVVAILMRTPFLVVGNAGTLQQLRDWGFTTFGEMFDESYDDKTNDIARYEMIIDQVQQASNLTTDELIQHRINMESKLDANFERLFEVATELSSDLQQSLNGIINNG